MKSVNVLLVCLCVSLHVLGAPPARITPLPKNQNLPFEVALRKDSSLTAVFQQPPPSPKQEKKMLNLPKQTAAQPRNSPTQKPNEMVIGKRQRPQLEKEIAQLPTQLKNLSVQPPLEQGSRQDAVENRQIPKQKEQRVKAEQPQIVKSEQPQDAQVPPKKPKRKRYPKKKNKIQPPNPDERPSQDVVSGVVNGQQAAAGKDLVAPDANAQQPAANEQKEKKKPRPPRRKPQPRPQAEAPGVDGGEAGNKNDENKEKKRRPPPRRYRGKKKASGGEGGPRPTVSTP